MKFVSPFLKRVVYPTLSGAGVFRRAAARGLAVVTYHGVVPEGYEPVDSTLDGNLVSAETLRLQLRLLKSNYDLVTPEDVLAGREGGRELPARAVLVTCDDGLLNHLTDMLPVLQQEKVRCLFFVTGASAGEQRNMLWYEEMFLMFLRAPSRHFETSCDGVVISGELGGLEQRRGVWWDSVKRLSSVDAEIRSRFVRAMEAEFGLEAKKGIDESETMRRRFGLLTASEVRELASAGMTIGAHTMSHPVLSLAPVEIARAEIGESRIGLESVLQRRVWAFAYPFGDARSVTSQVLAMPQAAGYSAAFLNFGGGLGAELPGYALPRIHVTADMSLAEFEAHVSGFYSLLQRRAGRDTREQLAHADGRPANES
jgi:peptidoglycan/xylan/chitin deacetylase (PgdA/CDA1 family)